MRITHAALERFDELGEHGDVPREELERLRDRYQARLDRLRDRLEQAERPPRPPHRGGRGPDRGARGRARAARRDAPRARVPGRAAARARGGDRRRRGPRAVARALTNVNPHWVGRWRGRSLGVVYGSISPMDNPTGLFMHAYREQTAPPASPHPCPAAVRRPRHLRLEVHLAVGARPRLRAVDEVEPLDRRAEQPRHELAAARPRSAGRASPAWRRARTRPWPPSGTRSWRRSRPCPACGRWPR